jgi:hypothetical protein
MWWPVSMMSFEQEAASVVDVDSAISVGRLGASRGIFDIH